MKRFMRFPGQLLPKRNQPDTNNITPVYPDTNIHQGWKEYKWTIILILIAFAILFTSIFSYAQAPKPGDRLPNLEFKPLTNYEHSEAKLSDFKGKVLILDFWATWCAPCVAMIPKMDSLQQAFAGRVQFISIAYQPENQVHNFMEKLEAQHHRQYHLAEVTGDTTLKNSFHPASYPHYVWIDAEGKVAAITGFQDINAGNIRKMLAGENPATTVKPYAEQPYDYHKPLLIGSNGGDGNNLLYHSLLTSYTPGLHPGLAIVNDTITGRKITCKNNSIHQLYELAWSDSGRNFNRQNTRLLVKDTTRLVNRKDAGQPYLDWLARGNGFCYELQVPRDLAPSALSMMRQDLDRYFTRYKASIIKEARQCLILSRIPGGRAPVTKGNNPDVRLDRFGWTVSNCSLGILCERLNYYQLLHDPVVDETGLADPIDLEVPIKQLSAKGGPDTGAINTELARYGLQLQPGKRTREILILSDRQP